MSSLLDLVRERIPPICEAEACRDADCSANLDGIDGRWLLIDLDCDELGLGSQRHADFVLVTEQRVVSCVELKGGTLRHAEDQLQESATYTDSHLVPGEPGLSFWPVLVHGQEFGPVRIRAWAQRRVTFRGEQFAIRRIRCGESLAIAIGSVS